MPKMDQSGLSTAALFILVLAFFAVITAGYLIYLQLSSANSTPARTSSTASASSINTTYAILKPATVPPKIAECSQTLSYDSNGNPSPIQCANGDLNSLAWNAMAALEPKVMALGYNPTQQQVTTAICTDGNAANADSTPSISAPIENTAYNLASLYYGWHFSINAQALLTGGGC